MLQSVKDPPTMLVFGLYEGDRISLDVPIGSSVGEVKKLFQQKLNIHIDEMNRKDLKILVLHYSGSDLDESWCFTDLGIPAGSTIRVLMREEVQPALYVYCTFNQETIEIVDKNLNVPLMMVEDLRTIVGNRSGLPVSIFRLVSDVGVEMYDGHQLYDYGLDSGSKIRLENWDGWNEFINLCIMGFTPQVLSQINHDDEVQSRFQLKVALFIAAHFGCADLARVLIKQGVRADEEIGVHPHRLWCTDQAHIETKKCAIHEATEQGQLNCLRLFVNHDITTVMAKDGHDLAALNIALRRQKKPCASFLLTRQWTRVPVGKLGSVTVQTMRMIKLWAEKAKERAYMRHGPSKSTLKRSKFANGPLVSHGEPVVDGFTRSPMMGKARSDNKEKDRRKAFETFFEVYGLKEDPELYFRQMGALENFKNLKLRRNTKWGNMLDKSDMGARFTSGLFPPSDDKAIEEVGFENKISSKPGSKQIGRPEGSVADSGQSFSRRNSFLGKQGRGGTLTSATADTIISEEEEEDGNKLPPLKAAGHRRVSTIAESSIPETEGKGKSSAAKPAFMNKNMKNKKAARERTGSPTNDIIEESEGEEEKVKSNKLPSIHKRSRKVSQVIEEEGNDTHVDGKEEKKSKSKYFQTPVDANEEKNNANISQSLPNLRSMDKMKTMVDDDRAPSPSGTVKTQNTQSSRKSRKRKRITSAVLLSQAKAAEGAVPLPLISQENQTRPFFYHNGKREEDLVIPMMDLVCKHQGNSSRDRAIKSLTIANSFKEKPWLTQVRMALSLTSQSIKRPFESSFKRHRLRDETFTSSQSSDSMY